MPSEEVMTDLDLILIAFGPWAGGFMLFVVLQVVWAIIQLRGK